MKIYRDTVVAGKTILRMLKPSTRIYKKKGEKRAAKSKPSSEAVKRINLMNAERKLTMILNHNFSDGDYHLTLTYKEIPTPEEAKKALAKFTRSLRTYTQKQGINFKWVAVTEGLNKRIHHHFVCTAIDPEVLNRNWQQGWVNIKQLDDSGNYYKLANYLIKETDKTFREPEAASKRRYSHSRNIEIPEVKRELVNYRELHKELQPIKGYQIDQDSVRRYEHSILGVECLEYIMIAIDKPIKQYKKGKPIKWEKHYKEDWEIQGSFEI